MQPEALKSDDGFYCFWSNTINNGTLGEGFAGLTGGSFPLPVVDLLF